MRIYGDHICSILYDCFSITDDLQKKTCFDENNISYDITVDLNRTLNQKKSVNIDEHTTYLANSHQAVRSKAKHI